ncbi:MAG TPA: hypothetical protein DDW88_00145 [Treponema sp.]|nr:hypothetical protein [Treponema sp.]
MTRNKIDIYRLIAELNEAKDAMQKTAASNAKAWERIEMGAVDELDYMALAYTIHNIYGVVENTGLRIARFFENNLNTDSWHKEIIERMKLEIPGLRKAFFSYEEYLLFDELRAFRHVFRNLYNRALHIERLNSLQSKMPKASDIFFAAIEKYIAFLNELSVKIQD